MRRTKWKMAVCIMLLCLNLAFIWGNSLLPGRLSSAISMWLQRFLHSSGDASQSEHGLLRKIAHFAEFTGLGVWCSWLWAMLGKKLILALPCGFLAACVDEIIQVFVPGRGPGVADVVLDTAGVCLGMAAIYLICTLQKKIQNESIGGNHL